VDWPAAVARRYVRGYAVSRIENTSPPKMHAAALDGPPGMAEKARPIDEAEGRTLIASYLHADHYDRYDFHAHHALFLIEAMIGSSATADAVLGEFEAMKDLEAKFGTRNAMAYALGFVIRRLPAAHRTKAEARVQALVAKHAGSGEAYTRDFLSYLVGGREALEKSGRKLGLYCLHFCNDPALIRSVADGLVTGWDAQHVVLAGDALLDALTPKKLRQIWQPWRPLVIEQLGILASPKAVAVLKEFATTKQYAAQVAAILAARSGKPAGATKPTATKQVAAKKPVAKPIAANKPVAKPIAAKKVSAKKVSAANKPAANKRASKKR
jgi:hypothetical protein